MHYMNRQQSTGSQLLSLPTCYYFGGYSLMLCKYFEKILPENFDEIDLKKCVKNEDLFSLIVSVKNSPEFSTSDPCCSSFLFEGIIDRWHRSQCIGSFSFRERRKKKRLRHEQMNPFLNI